MSDEQPVVPVAHDSEALLYDWFKHLTSLSLLTIGGILSISQLVAQGGLKKHTIMVLLIAVGISGLMGFSGAETIVQARSTGTPVPKRIHLMRKIGTGAFGMGVGAFLFIFTKAVYK